MKPKVEKNIIEQLANVGSYTDAKGRDQDTKGRDPIAKKLLFIWTTDVQEKYGKTLSVQYITTRDARRSCSSLTC